MTGSSSIQHAQDLAPQAHLILVRQARVSVES